MAAPRESLHLFADGADNCPVTANPGQEDLDLDGAGDACDLDDDADGLSDTDETGIYLTDPLDADTDDDGFDDGVEVLAGTNPLDENDFPTPPVPALPVWALALLAILLGGTARAAHLGQRTFDA